jgi:biotin carboxylase
VQRILLLMATRTYRAKAFMTAAHRLGGDVVVVGTERAQALAGLADGRTLALDFEHPDIAVDDIVSYAASRPLTAVIGVDDDTTLVAAMADRALGLTGNSPASVEAAQNKYRMRVLLKEAGECSPLFQLVSTEDKPVELASSVNYPCVLKPVFLAASRGVIRADSEGEFVQAFERIKRILADPEVRERGGEWAGRILVEDFVPGGEVALEGLLEDGRLQVLALFDKPDPLDGPFFEETIYLAPSRLADSKQIAVAGAVERSARALGLKQGPVHAELRLNGEGEWLIEIAARSIGGLCSTVLEFGTGLSLEDLILRQAIGVDIPPLPDELRPAGVMMIPIPRRGRLNGVKGRELAEQVEGIDGIEISIPLGREVVPLPEGDRYLGFIFAHGKSVDAVEASLREAHRRLEFLIA